MTLFYILTAVVLQATGKPPHIIFIVADDLGEYNKTFLDVFLLYSM